MQLVGEAPNPTDHIVRPILELRQRLLRVHVLNVAGRTFEVADGHGHEDQLLAHIVVEIPGDVRSCCLLCADEASSQVSNLFIAPSELCVRASEIFLGHVSPRHGCAYDQSDDASDNQECLYQQQGVID